MARHFKNFWILLLGNLISYGKSNDVYYNLTENLPANTYLGNVAQDAGLYPVNNPSFNTSIKYSFLKDNPYVTLFNINSRESSLYTSKKLDREDLCEYKITCVFHLEVIAQCETGACYDKIKVNVELTDLNDNRPAFPRTSETLDFSEGSEIGTSLPVSGAVDRDNGNFSIQQYSIQQEFPILTNLSDPYFSVTFANNFDISFVNIVLNKKLDRETTDHFRLRLIATDGGIPPKSGNMTLLINVLDINEFAPIFTKSVYNISVNEDIETNSTILFVSARDPDQGVNGQITYRLNPNQDVKILTLFNIDELTGEIKVNGSLKYEPGEIYKIKVWASDQATAPLIGQAQVFIYVKDVHNNAPQISVNLLSNSGIAEISEHASLGAAVAHIKINDPDNGLNGDVNCSVMSDKFKLQTFIEGREYKVVVSGTLDREFQSIHRVAVTCTDLGLPPKNASTFFDVTILDENDNFPIFSKQTYTVYIAENNIKGESLLTVNAADNDSGKNSKIHYELNHTEGFDFLIDPLSGNITVSFVLDRENVSSFSFLVLAIDGGSSPKTGTASVIVHVLDENDNSPIFSIENYVFSVIENMSRNVSVGLLLAKDNDVGENKTISFSILPQYKNAIPFTVLPGGRVISSEVLDREVISRYDFSVIASDHGSPPLKTSAHVIIHVLDTNDNSPIFLFPNSMNNTVVISYQIPANAVFATVQARDPDDGQNSKLYYSFRNNNVSHLFNLNGLNGVLTLTRQLSSSDANRYTFGIVVEDGGSPPRMTERAMTIVVTARGLDGSVVTDAPHTNKQYFLIAVAIACITVVLAVIILTAIYLIKRSDRKFAYSEKDDREDGKDEEPEKTKSVSFTFKKTKTATTANRTQTKTEQEKPTEYYPSHDSFQVSLSGSPIMSDTRIPEVGKSGTGSNTSPQNIRHLLHLQEIPSSSRLSKPPHTLNGILKRPQNFSDYQSDISDDTPSDSGKGGSEIDLTSSGFTHSADYLKSIPASQRKMNVPPPVLNKYNMKRPLGYFPKENRHQTPYSKSIPHNSIILKTYGESIKPPGLFIKKSIVQNSTGSNHLSSGHDDSTTTSGSYTLDHEADKYQEVRQLSKQSVL